MHMQHEREREEKRRGRKNERAREKVEGSTFFLARFFSFLFSLPAAQLRVTFLLYPFRETPEKLNSRPLSYL